MTEPATNEQIADIKGAWEHDPVDEMESFERGTLLEEGIPALIARIEQEQKFHKEEHLHEIDKMQAEIERLKEQWEKWSAYSDKLEATIERLREALEAQNCQCTHSMEATPKTKKCDRCAALGKGE